MPPAEAGQDAGPALPGGAALHIYISTYLSNYLTIYSQAGLLVCGNWDSRAEETCSSLSDGVWTRSLVLIQDRFAHMTSHDLT